jgi:hypothetical protein
MNEISIRKLNATYGPHWKRVLTGLRFARKGWFTITTGPLPSAADYPALQRAAFTLPINSIIEDALSELEALRDEMQDAYDNLPEGFQNGSQGEALQGAIDELDNVVGNDIDVPEYLTLITAYVVPAADTRHASRASRGGQAAYMLRQAGERLQELTQEGAVLPPELVVDTERHGEINELADLILEAADAADGVNWPTAFGN